jgi:hypothetical protein
MKGPAAAEPFVAPNGLAGQTTAADRQRTHFRRIESELAPAPPGALHWIADQVSADSSSVITSPAPIVTGAARPAWSLKTELIGVPAGMSNTCQPALLPVWPGPVRLTLVPQVGPEQDTFQSTV